MAFSFNWAGMSVPQVNAYDGTENAMRDASKAALAARGFERRAADSEYAELLERRNSELERMDGISARISSLQKRNEEIRALLASMEQKAVDPGEYNGQGIYPGGIDMNLDRSLMPRDIHGPSVSGVPVNSVFGG